MIRCRRDVTVAANCWTSRSSQRSWSTVPPTSSTTKLSNVQETTVVSVFVRPPDVSSSCGKSEAQFKSISKRPLASSFAMKSRCATAVLRKAQRVRRALTSPFSAQSATLQSGDTILKITAATNILPVRLSLLTRGRRQPPRKLLWKRCGRES
jgi:hypothetical protein